jgi:hypothetical protein
LIKVWAPKVRATRADRTIREKDLMSIFAKSALLGLGLLASVAPNAFAQRDNIAALPPSASVSTPVLVGPTGNPVVASPNYVGPNPGKLWGGQERQSMAVQPSPVYPGPALNSDVGDE